MNNTKETLTTYLVGIPGSTFEEGEFALVQAVNEEQAADAFLYHFAANDDSFLEHVYFRTINMSFAEHFWLQTEEDGEAFSERGEVIIDAEEFARRVSAFFGKQKNFANLYLRHYFDDSLGIFEEDMLPEQIKTKFPPKMLSFIWKNSGYSNGITVFNLADIDSISSWPTRNTSKD